jgi:hypothetical protein
MIARFQFHASA